MKKLLLMIPLLISSLAYAGGTPEFVSLPEGYSKQVHYTTLNRIGQEQVAKLFARESLLKAVADGTPVPEGSTVVMEIYTPKKDRNGTIITDDKGNYLTSHRSAVAVMEYRSEWPEEMPASERSGNWGFALYDDNGKPKANKLDCTGCHWELRRVNYLFTTVPMTNHINSKP